jgi:uncharacterized protein
MEVQEINYNNQLKVTETDPFITTAFKGRTSFWSYLLMSVAPFLVSNFIGSIPLLVVMFMYASPESMVTSGGMPDFAAMGVNLNLAFVLMVFPFLLALLTFVLLIKPVNKRTLATVINGGRPVRWGRIFTSAGVWVVISALYMYFSIKEDPSNFIINNTSDSLIVLAVLSILLIPFQAAFEEILFRGYLNQGFAVWTRSRWMPMVFTSILFGLMHSLNPEVSEYGFLTMIPQYIFFGLIFSIPTMLDGGIEIAIGAHAANNAFLSVFMTSKASALQTPALYMQITTYPWKEFAGLVISSVVFLVVMFLIYRWSDLSKLYSRIIIKAEGEVTD